MHFLGKYIDVSSRYKYWSCCRALLNLCVVINCSKILRKITKKQKVKIIFSQLFQNFTFTQVLKLYAWEKSFEKQVLEIRETELQLSKKIALLRALSSFVWTCAPFLVSFD